MLPNISVVKLIRTTISKINLLFLIKIYWWVLPKMLNSFLLLSVAFALYVVVADEKQTKKKAFYKINNKWNKVNKQCLIRTNKPIMMINKSTSQVFLVETVEMTSKKLLSIIILLWYFSSINLRSNILIFLLCQFLNSICF